MVVKADIQSTHIHSGCSTALIRMVEEEDIKESMSVSNSKESDEYDIWVFHSWMVSVYTSDSVGVRMYCFFT